MSARSFTAIACGAALSAIAACGSGGSAPSLEILEAAPAELDPSQDSENDLTIKLRYTDANADLGGGVAEVHDCRGEDLVTRIPIPPIASDEAVAEGVAIEGELTLLVPDIGGNVLNGTSSVCAGLGAGSPSGSALPFCIVLVDAAGERSQGACTTPIRVASQTGK